MKRFNHVGTPLKPEQYAKQITIDDQGLPRQYQTPFGDIYPSITTSLTIVKEEILLAWRKRVGDKVADQESNWGKSRGTKLHDIFEKYLKNEPVKEFPLFIKSLFYDIQSYLDCIDNIQCQETPLYSNIFQLAGRCDVIAEYKGILSVVDFKGSKRPKKRDWITDYFMQCSFYAYAYYELTGIKIPQIVVLIATEQGKPQEWIENPADWWKELKKVRKQYKEKFGI